MGDRWYPLLLGPAQKIVRSLLFFPFTAEWMWKHLPALRSYFAGRYSKARFITKFDGGSRIWVSPSDHIESQIFWQEVQEGDRGEVKLLKLLLRPDDVFIDVGANVGVFTLIMARRLSNGTVHAFEPSRYHFEKLRSNLLLNQFNNVRVHQLALSNRRHQSKLHFPPSNGLLSNTGMASQFQFERTFSRTEEIECVSLDEYAASHGIAHIDLMKIDVEGAEMDVLAGAIRSIHRNRPHVVMEVNLTHLKCAGHAIDEVIEFWATLNYEVFRIDDNAALHHVRTAADLVEHQNIYCRPFEQVAARRH